MHNHITKNIPYDIVWVCTIQYKNGRIHNNKIIPAFIVKNDIDHTVYLNRESYPLIGINTYHLIQPYCNTLGIKCLSNKEKPDLSFNIRYD